MFLRVDLGGFFQFFACAYSDHSCFRIFVLQIWVVKNMAKKRTSACKTGRFCSVSEGRSSWIFSVFRVAKIHFDKTLRVRNTTQGRLSRIR